jgi:hypothetical protein
MSVRDFVRRLRRSGAAEGTDDLHASMKELAGNIASAVPIEQLQQLAKDPVPGVKAAGMLLRDSPLRPTQDAVRSLHASVREQSHLINGLKAYLYNPSRMVTERVMERLTRIANAERILVGPWTADPGMEVLYWLPFVRWFAGRFNVAPARLHALSCGGAPWYADVAEGYTDILSLYGLAEYRARTPSGARPKRGFERHLISQGRALASTTATLHPGLMFRLFGAYWKYDAPVQQVIRHLHPAPPPRRAARPAGLPARYVAVQFPVSEAFPDSSSNRAWVRRVVTSLQHSHDVVWLGPPLDADEIAPDPGARMQALPLGNEPATWLAQQAAAVAGADAFIGSYGSMAFVAAAAGVNAVGFHSADMLFPHHLTVAAHVLGDAQDKLVVLRTGEPLLERIVSR